jgi:hypothetical protein
MFDIITAEWHQRPYATVCPRGHSHTGIECPVCNRAAMLGIIPPHRVDRFTKITDSDDASSALGKICTLY